MSRNLLPRLRQAPNPANVPPARVGEWTELSTPGALAQLDFGTRDDGIRTRIQSIPSPWARMLLFKNAFEEDGHPARLLVQSELLDALEFLWSMKSMAGAQPEFRTIHVSGIDDLSKNPASQRVERFARALLELIPRRLSGSIEPAFEAITIVLVDGKPVLATSPYTLLFSCEDASTATTGALFRYAKGSKYRPLRERPAAFQRYVAQVVLPQLNDVHGITNGNTDGAAVLRLVKPWLDEEVRAVQQVSAEGSGLKPPAGGDWNSAARLMGLSRISALLGGVALFSREAGAQMTESRWVVRSSRSNVKNPPLIIDQSSFDGVYFAGAPKVNVPKNLSDLDRRVLPGNGLQYPWIEPSRDWFSDRLLVLAEPLEPESVLGLERFQSSYDGEEPHLRAAQTTLPFRSDLFRYFTPEDVAARTRVEIQRDGRIVVSLEIPVGNGSTAQDIVIRRVYDETSIQPATGPSLALWPRFRSEEWRLYSLFRRDANPNVADFIQLVASVAGEALKADTEQRNSAVRVAAFDAPPEVVEFVSSVSAGGADGCLGVILPRYAAPQASTQAKLNVGIDFGTSNTVVSVRSDSGQVRDIFGVESQTLPLTRSNRQTQALVDAYFLPHTMAAAPFGTAVMHFEHLQNHNIMTEPVGVRINIPFSGVVETDDRNRIVGDLKWSTDAAQQFLSAAFLRHLLVVIAADSVQRGTRIENVAISWAYPRSFSPQQVNHMRHLWSQVHQSLGTLGIELRPLKEPVDESRAVLRHFFNANALGTAGDASAIIDIGGGTSDIAVYGRGKTLLLDSVMLGGRNLTGQRQQGSTAADFANPFVEAFIRWSESHQLSEYLTESRAVRKYLADRQDHLAFSYLIQTHWFKQFGGQFSGDDAFHRFQGLVFYFFGSLFYYLGLSMRPSREVPRMVMLAGNGSQYMHWLTDLVSSADKTHFTTAFGKLLIAGAGSPSGAVVPEIRLTNVPKQEVALGLVAPVEAEKLAEDAAIQRSVIGESIAVALGSTGEQRTMAATDRLEADTIIEASRVATLTWQDGETEIQRFHSSLLKEISTLTSYGSHWQQSASRMRAFIDTMGGDTIKNLTRSRLQYYASLHEGFHGSLFIMEASVILEQMLSNLFSTDATRPAQPNTNQAARPTQRS